jgi:hypothetical protein
MIGEALGFGVAAGAATWFGLLGVKQKVWPVIAAKLKARAVKAAAAAAEKTTETLGVLEGHLQQAVGTELQKIKAAVEQQLAPYEARLKALEDKAGITPPAQH